MRGAAEAYAQCAALASRGGKNISADRRNAFAEDAVHGVDEQSVEKTEARAAGSFDFVSRFV
jgi:hypothetical protein